MYDYLIVGAGLFGAVFAHEMTKVGKTCHVIDKRNHIGGNCYTKNESGIIVHKYGAHIFRTDDRDIWSYVNDFAEFNRFTNCPVARYKDELFNLPFNMNTFYELWGVKTPDEAKMEIERQRIVIETPKNLEEKVLSLVGTDVYEKLVKGYTEKQWGMKCTELPPDIIARIPIRLTFDNNYFNERYQGVPIGGYTPLFEKMLSRSRVDLSSSYDGYYRTKTHAKKIVYCGRVDELYGYEFGRLPHRSLKFEEKRYEKENVQGNAVVNYTDYDVPYTRSIEHKHFEGTKCSFTIVTKEFPAEYKGDAYPFYPIKNSRSIALYEQYKKRALNDGIILGGSVAEYEDYTMDETIKSALNKARKEIRDES